MHCNGKCSIPSLEIGEIWGHCRDHLKGTTPLAQAQIECLQRDYLAPSKAHIKRITRVRKRVLRARPAPTPSRVVDHHNEAKRLGERVKLISRRIEYGATSHLDAPPTKRAPVAFDYTRNATVPKVTETRDFAYYAAESARLEREMQAERARMEAMK